MSLAGAETDSPWRRRSVFFWRNYCRMCYAKLVLSPILRFMERRQVHSFIFAKYNSLQLLLKFDSYAFSSMHKMHEVHAGKEVHEQNLCGSTY